MARPIIAFLTDFGLRDHYVAAMKGVTLGICPEATLVDVTHDVPAQDILAGALELADSALYFPEGTVFVAVVDPGVGSARRGVAVEAAGRWYVAPDNGLLTAVLDGASAWHAVELTERRYARADVSPTFEGRDRFAPAGAWLARGIDLAALGPPVTDLVRLDIPRASHVGGAVQGSVLRVDRFGNLVTNIAGRDIASLTGAPAISVAGAEIESVVTTYADAAPGVLCALVGSTDRLEIAVNGGSAASVLGLGRGAVVRVRGRSNA